MEPSPRQRIVLFTFCILVDLLFISCKPADNQGIFIEKLETLRHTFAPDSRTSIFTYELKNGILKGKTDNAFLKTEVEELISKWSSSIIDSLKLLPATELDADTIAFVNVSVCNIRANTAESAELSTQALLGTPLKVLERSGSWYRVQTPDKYLGYVENSAISFSTEFQDNSRKVVYTEPFGFAFQSKNSQSERVSDLTFGDILILVKRDSKMSEIQYPDGRMAFVPTDHLRSLSDFVLGADPFQISKKSQSMLGIPYLWGGTSWKGVDCSGFTRTAFLMQGIYLPRDASQQAVVGDSIDTEDGLENLKEGDLLFFGRISENRPIVTHVALYLGNMKFIHSSGMVKYGSFDPSSVYYDEFNLNRFLFARRIIGSKNLSYLNPEKLY